MQQREVQDWVISLMIFTQTVKEELARILLKLELKADKRILPNLFYEHNITLIPKPDKETTRKL